MSARDLERLLGGYAAGTLTESEHGELMRAALDDQQLFDALADEEALRDALADPVFRARLRARLAPEPQRNLRWMWWLAPVMAAGLALIFVLNRPEPQRPFQSASVKAPENSVPAPTPQTTVPAPAPQTAASAPPPRDSEARPLRSAPPPTPAQQPLPPPPPPPAAPKPAPALAGAVPESVSVAASEPILSAEKKTSKDEARAPAQLRKAVTETDALTAAALDLQVERSINGRFESTELGALRRGDRVRFRVRVPESGTLVMTAGPTLARSTLAEVGRTYYLPDANGLPPGEAPLEVAIALHPMLEGERGSTLFRARQAASDKPAATALGGAAPVAALPAPPPPAVMRDSRREDTGKDKEQAAPKQEAAVGRLTQTANQALPPTAPRTVLLRLEFKPR